jgi:hypothetical protein
MKNTLAENMRRFGTKNLKEDLDSNNNGYPDEFEGNSSSELNMGDVIKINPRAFPDFEFPYGTKGVVMNIDKADYASDDLVYTVKIKHIDSQGDEANTLHVENPHQFI